jgi:hypothetical protein
MKPTDKAILGMVSESSGRNESEPSNGLVKKWFPKVEFLGPERRLHGTSQTG